MCERERINLISALVFKGELRFRGANSICPFRELKMILVVVVVVKADTKTYIYTFSKG